MADSAGAPSTRVHYMLAVIRALASQGGAARPMEVYDWIEKRGLRKEQIPPAGVDAEGHYRREVRFARQELADGGIVRTSNGAWKIVNPAIANTVTTQTAREIIRDNRRRREARRSGKGKRLPATTPSESRPPLAVVRTTTGPAPAPWVGMVAREPGPTSTYVFRFRDSDVWKVGFAADVENRLRQINQHIPIELLSEGWRIAKCVSWPSADLAYAMEQQLLLNLAKHRTMFERVRCSAERLDRAWEDAVSQVR